MTLGSAPPQTSPVRLWWPNGHGARPGYHLTVAGFQGGSLVLKTETKVRGTDVAGRFGSALLVDQ